MRTELVTVGAAICRGYLWFEESVMVGTVGLRGGALIGRSRADMTTEAR